MNKIKKLFICLVLFIITGFVFNISAGAEKINRCEYGISFGLLGRDDNSDADFLFDDRLDDHQKITTILKNFIVRYDDNNIFQDVGNWLDRSGSFPVDRVWFYVYYDEETLKAKKLTLNVQKSSARNNNFDFNMKSSLQIENSSKFVSPVDKNNKLSGEQSDVEKLTEMLNENGGCPKSIRISVFCNTDNVSSLLCGAYLNTIQPFINSKTLILTEFEAKEKITLPSLSGTSSKILEGEIIPVVQLDFLLNKNADEKSIDQVKENCTDVHMEDVSNILYQLPDGLKDDILLEDSSELSSKLKTYFSDILNFHGLSCDNTDEIKKRMQEYSDVLANFNQEIRQCARKENINLNADTFMIDGYNLNAINRLEYLFSSDNGISNEKNIEILCNRKKPSELKNQINNICDKNYNTLESAFGETAKNITFDSAQQCKSNLASELIKNFNCNKHNLDDVIMYGKTASFNATTDVEYVLLYSIFVDAGVFKQDSKIGSIKNAEVEKCEELKKNDVEVKNITNKIFQEDESYNELVENISKDISNISNIKTESGICRFLFSKSGIGDYIKGANNLIMVVGIVITIILSIMDGIKAFASFKDDESKKFTEHLKIRLICIALLIIIPTLIKFLINFIGKSCEI